MAAPERKRTAGLYARKLFNNVYNYTLLGGVALASLATGDWWLLAVGAGLEVLYMLYAPDSEFVRGKVNGMLDAEDAAAAQAHLENMLQRMASEDRQRCRQLLLKQNEIARLANDNPSFSRDMLQVEITKLGRLVASFVDLAATVGRYTLYLDKEDIGEVERQRRDYEREVEKGKGPAVDLAKKNLDIVMRRLERLREINEFVQRARHQMELIENSFALLADQIVSMQSPAAMSGQLDDLLDGVEAIRETAQEADKFLATGVSA